MPYDEKTLQYSFFILFKAQNECQKFGGQIAVGMRPSDRGQRTSHTTGFGASDYQVFLADIDAYYYLEHTPDGMYDGPQWLGYRQNSKKIERNILQ